MKLVMSQDAIVTYQWTSDGLLNVDTHGDRARTGGPREPSHMYKRERQVSGGEGTLQAIFDGTHGWFWRNRMDRNVTLELTVEGEYQEIRRVL